MNQRTFTIVAALALITTALGCGSAPNSEFSDLQQGGNNNKRPDTPIIEHSHNRPTTNGITTPDPNISPQASALLNAQVSAAQEAPILLTPAVLGQQFVKGSALDAIKAAVTAGPTGHPVTDYVASLLGPTSAEGRENLSLLLQPLRSVTTWDMYHQDTPQSLLALAVSNSKSAGRVSLTLKATAGSSTDRQAVEVNIMFTAERAREIGETISMSLSALDKYGRPREFAELLDVKQDMNWLRGYRPQSANTTTISELQAVLNKFAALSNQDYDVAEPTLNVMFNRNQYSPALAKAIRSIGGTSSSMGGTGYQITIPITNANAAMLLGQAGTLGELNNIIRHMIVNAAPRP